MRVIIAGGRDFNDYDLLVKKCDYFLQDQDDITVVSGEARGADKLGEKYAKERGYNVDRFPANWDKYGKGAGPIRNKQMAEHADSLILFWDGKSKGSKNMLETAKKLRLKIRIINY